MGWTNEDLSNTVSSNLNRLNELDKVENVDRTIYVETTGNDNSGNGTISRPYATFFKAITDIKPIISEVAVTIQFGVGSFDLTSRDFVEVGKKSLIGNAEIQIIGAAMTDIVTDITLAAQSGKEFRFDVSGNTFTEDEHVDRFVKYGSKYSPIIKNDVSTLDTFVEAGTGTAISELTTTLNVLGDWALTPAAASGRIYFERIKFDFQGENIPMTGQDIYTVFKYSLLTNFATMNIGTKLQFQGLLVNASHLVPNSTSNGVNLLCNNITLNGAIRCANRAIRGLSLNFVNGDILAGRLMVRNAEYGVRLKPYCTFFTDFEANNFVALLDCSYGFEMPDAGSLITEGTQPLYIDNVNYLLGDRDYVPTYGAQISMNLYGTPNSGNLSPNLVAMGYIDVSANWFIKIN